MSKFKQMMSIIEEGLLKPQSDADIKNIRESAAANVLKEKLEDAARAENLLKSAKRDYTLIPSTIAVKFMNGKYYRIVDIKNLKACIDWLTVLEKVVEYAKTVGYKVNEKLVDPYNEGDPFKIVFYPFYTSSKSKWTYNVTSLSSNELASDPIDEEFSYYKTQLDFYKILFDTLIENGYDISTSAISGFDPSIKDKKIAVFGDIGNGSSISIYINGKYSLNRSFDIELNPKQKIESFIKEAESKNVK